MELNREYFVKQGTKGGKKAWKENPEGMKAISSKGGKNRWKNHVKKSDKKEK